MGLIKFLKEKIWYPLKKLLSFKEEKEKEFIKPKTYKLNIILKLDYESERGTGHNFDLREEIVIETSDETREQDIINAIEKLKDKALETDYLSGHDDITEMLINGGTDIEYKKGKYTVDIETNNYIIGVEEL